MPSSSSASKQNAASVPSEDTAYRVKPSQDLSIVITKAIYVGHSSHQLRSIICLSKTSLATIIGLADFVCQMDTERSSAPRATTEQMLEVATGEPGLRRNMWGLYAWEHEFRVLPCSTRTHSYFHSVFMPNKANF